MAVCDADRIEQLWWDSIPWRLHLRTTAHLTAEPAGEIAEFTRVDVSGDSIRLRDRGNLSRIGRRTIHGTIEVDIRSHGDRESIRLAIPVVIALGKSRNQM